MSHDDLFHQAALTAYCKVAAECGTWPDREAVRRKAYAICEAELARKNGAN